MSRLPDKVVVKVVGKSKNGGMEHETRPVALDRREGNDHVIDDSVRIDHMLKPRQLLNLTEYKISAVNPKEAAVMLKHRFQEAKLRAVFLIVQRKRKMHADHGKAVRYCKEGVKSMLKNTRCKCAEKEKHGGFKQGKIERKRAGKSRAA